MHNEFTSFSECALTFARMEAKLVTELHIGLDHVAKVIEQDAKAELGHYQNEVGHFPAWEQLAPSTQADRVRQGYTPNDPGLRSGEMQQSITHDTDVLEAMIGSDDQNLVWFELGTEKQPPRPVFGPAVFKRKELIQKIIGAAAVSGLIGRSRLPAELGYDMDIKD